MKPNNLLISIDRTTNVVKYITWAMQEDDPKRKLDWLKEADYFIDEAKKWLNKEIPF